ncbi:MAG: DUF502 domain-containing protein [Elusimicrobiota bacterium]|jgi:uncharacterized membrane protein|nr:DUF502 domain-containing protein [Elusimicrobiota bacterium]
MENDIIKPRKTFKEKIVRILKNYLVMGIIIIIPLWLTYFVVSILFGWVSNFTFPIISAVLNAFTSDHKYYLLAVKISSFFISMTLICSLGFIANNLFGKTIIKFIEQIIRKIPMVGAVYFSAQQFVNFIFSDDKTKGFKQVILVPYPNEYSLSVAFLTNKTVIQGKEYICAFMPTTPNPSTGFLMLFNDEKKIIYTDYTIEQAFQFIISVGVISLGEKYKTSDTDNKDMNELKEEIEKLKKGTKKEEVLKNDN